MIHTITITGIESKATKTGNTRVVLLTERQGKFHFFQLQKGKPSPTMLQFEKFKFKLGDTVDVDSQDEEKSFTNDQGKEITFTEHWIQKFVEVEGIPQTGTNVPSTPQNAATGQKSANNDEIAAINERLDKASKAFIALRDELLDRMKSLETLVSTVTSENAVALHTSLKNHDIHEVKTPETAAAIVDSYKSDPEIPVIGEVPKGFDK